MSWKKILFRQRETILFPNFLQAENHFEKHYFWLPWCFYYISIWPPFVIKDVNDDNDDERRRRKEERKNLNKFSSWKKLILFPQRKTIFSRISCKQKMCSKNIISGFLGVREHRPWKCDFFLVCETNFFRIFRKQKISLKNIISGFLGVHRP